MEQHIQTQETICKGLIIKQEFILDLNEKQEEVIRAVAIQCDCSFGEVFDHLVEDKNRKLLIQLFKGDLEKVKEKLIEKIYDFNFS